LSVMLLAKHPSLELSWLPLSDRKTMPTPAVAFMDLDWCSACYLRRGDRHENLESTGATDMIVLSTHWGGDIRPSCIAHEYRHMQQHYLPDLPKAYADGMLQLDFGDTRESWLKSIRQFYRAMPWESDALRYELRLSPDQQNEESWQASFG
jgi:hypothetical protein